jgi:hypothetical protein
MREAERKRKEILERQQPEAERQQAESAVAQIRR